MKKTLHKADSRGDANHGWLHSRHTFSFAEYRDPERVRFGLLRVINDDEVRPGMGFGPHPHENMEIISIPLTGELRHQDSMGNSHHIKAGEVQIMSAGTGLTHSEYNGSESELVNFLQIWVFPKEKNIEPRYDQKQFSVNGRLGQFQNIVSPNPDDDGVWINQDAWFFLGDFQMHEAITYDIKKPENGAYVFILEGSAIVAGEELKRRDGQGIEGASSIEISAIENCQLLVIEVPMR